MFCGIGDELRALIRRPVAVSRSRPLNVVRDDLRDGLACLGNILESGTDERLMQTAARLEVACDIPHRRAPRIAVDVDQDAAVREDVQHLVKRGDAARS